MAGKYSPACTKCPTSACTPWIKANEQPDLDQVPNFCPMKCMPEVMEKAIAEYDKPEVREFTRKASIQEAECYERVPDGRRTKNPRILELIEFAQKCGYQRLGLAFCGSLANEARMLTEVLENKGFEVISVKCKIGATPEERIGIRPEEKIVEPEQWETMCNPIAQAEILNSENVDLAIMLGLCIGHDTLFIRYCQVPMIVIAVKDRVTGHTTHWQRSIYPRPITQGLCVK